ncbi:MAG: hypothetical protein Q9170_005536 [Blastenia crenularia]
MATETTAPGHIPGTGIELDNLIHNRSRDIITNEELAIGHQRENDTWWSNNIALNITHDPPVDHPHSRDPRDYLALERTYLAHIRTASALVSFGVALYQLFRLKNVDTKAGLALGAICAGGGAVMALTGGYRYFQEQRHLFSGKILAGGVGIWIGWIAIMSITVAVFVVVLTED